VSQSYKKPLLLETFAEIHLGPGSLPSEAFFNLVPELQNLGLKKIKLEQIGSIKINPAMQGQIQQSTTPRVRCWSEDDKKLVQLSQDQLAVNQVGEYLGWDQFRDLFAKTLTVLERINRNFVSLSLNTIDRLIAPEADFTLGKYLNCGGSKIPSWYKDCKEAADITLGRGTLPLDGMNRQIHVRVRKEIGSFSVQVQSVFHNRLNVGEDVRQTLEKLHTESTESFESWITIVTRNEVMKGLK